jgi:formylmethanofuran dehydrogenase subunit E
MTIDPVLVKQAMDFYGHWYPGLAIGIRAAEWALEEMGKAPDEEIVAVVETDMCAVDAIQSLTGCTFGKGNLIHKEYGKSAFAFYRRQDGKAALLVARPDLYGEARVTLERPRKKLEAEGLTEEEDNVLDHLWIFGTWYPVLFWTLRAWTRRAIRQPCNTQRLRSAQIGSLLVLLR